MVIVSVVATKDLRPGDVLRRFSDQGDPRGGTNSNRYVLRVYVCVIFVSWYSALHGYKLVHSEWFVLFFL